MIQMDLNLTVTTVYDPDPAILASAQGWAEKLNSRFVPRDRNSLPTIMNMTQTSIILLASKEGPVVHTPGGRYFFHLSMAELRIKQLVNGKHDHMVTAMGLAPGMSVLDCTLGLASDAIVASYIVGTKGTVIGLEKSPLIALVAELGLGSFIAEDPEVTAALRRVKVKMVSHFDYLQKLPDSSFDIVFLDPMFRNPVESSSNLKPLRYLADSQPVTALTLKEAARVARCRVVVKEARGSTVFRDLGISTLVGGKYSSVQYGVLEVER